MRITVVDDIAKERPLLVKRLKEDSRFFPCSRGAVVNLEHVADLADASFVMDEGSTVLISRKLVKMHDRFSWIFFFREGIDHD